MNKNIVRGGLAGIAVLALAVGGSTFAQWSDSQTAEDQNAGAGKLVLELKGPNGIEAVQHADYGNFAPGEGKDVTRFLMSKQGDAVPLADLFVTMRGLQNADNGCSSDSEDTAESGACTGETTSGGEFGKDAQIKVEASGPTTSNCGNVSYSTVYNGNLNQLHNNQVDLGAVDNGEGICMRSTVTLPYSSGNDTQGDSANWDWQFDLVQQ